MSGSESARQFPKQELHLFLGIGDGGIGWRLDGSGAESIGSLHRYIKLAQIAEEARFDGVFRADSPHLPLVNHRGGPWPTLEPISLLSAIAAGTERVGLITTASTTWNEPYNLARTLATLDSISSGRAAWNIVTSAAGQDNFGVALPPQADRYRRAGEFVEVVRKLWSSWQPDAIVVDRQAGRFARAERIHAADHNGERFRVAGALDVPRSPQGEPVLVQAGSSEIGKDFGAAYADVVFAAVQDRDDTVAFRRDVHARAAAASRSAPPLFIAGVTLILGETEREAEQAATVLRGFIDQEAALDALERSFGGADFRGLDPRLPVPANRFPDTTTLSGRQSRPELLKRLSLVHGRSLQDLLDIDTLAGGHLVLIGTPSSVATLFEDWQRTGAVDGFILFPTNQPAALDLITGDLLPRLRSRGLFRRDYVGSTLREHLGLPITKPYRPRTELPTWRARA